MANGDERFLITGALGCIGAWVCKRLTDEGVPVVAYDLPGEPRRLRAIMAETALAKVRYVAGDITDAEAFERAVAEHGITHVVHLAGLQVPFVRAEPVRGAAVNVVGTAVVLETAKRLAGQIRGTVFASTIGVYGAADAYPPGPLAHDAPLRPPTLYGVTKQANEGYARIYWHDHGVRALGLRPAFVYGPGRDQGVSATPTKAMVAAALGRPYRVSFGGRAVYQHADDVAAAFVQAARALANGAPGGETYTLGGTSADLAQIVAAIEAVAPEMAGQITFDPDPMAVPEDVDDAPVERAIGPLSWRPLQDGVRDTMEQARAAVTAGTLDPERAIS